MVGKCCCERKVRGAAVGRGKRKLCFCRGEIGRNLGPCWCTESVLMPSGFEIVCCRWNSGDRFMNCGDFLGGDVGRSLMC